MDPENGRDDVSGSQLQVPGFQVSNSRAKNSGQIILVVHTVEGSENSRPTTV